MKIYEIFLFTLIFISIATLQGSFGTEKDRMQFFLQGGNFSAQPNLKKAIIYSVRLGNARQLEGLLASGQSVLKLPFEQAETVPVAQVLVNAVEKNLSLREQKTIAVALCKKNKIDILHCYFRNGLISRECIDSMILQDWQKAIIFQGIFPDFPSESCSICFRDKNKQRINCGHYFHKTCIERWLKRNNPCPVCRQVVK